jgi:hypothetical protein
MFAVDEATTLRVADKALRVRAALLPTRQINTSYLTAASKL